MRAIDRVAAELRHEPGPLGLISRAYLGARRLEGMRARWQATTATTRAMIEEELRAKLATLGVRTNTRTPRR